MQFGSYQSSCQTNIRAKFLDQGPRQYKRDLILRDLARDLCSPNGKNQQ
jgi:hypothetical protein